MSHSPETRRAANTLVCPGCGRLAAEAGAFCEHCGVDLARAGARRGPAAQPPQPPQPPAPPSPMPAQRGSQAAPERTEHPFPAHYLQAAGRFDLPDWLYSRRTALRAAATALVVVLVVVGVLLQVNTRRHLRESQARLLLSQNHLALTAATLGATEGTLADTKSDLADETAKLQSTTDDLTAVRSTLADAKGKANLQASQIQTLKSCLGGVSEALTDVTDEDYDGAIAALDSVHDSCQAAGDLF